ncbi:hypothetical protein AOQ72_16775 [Bradyrhizobium yuanmingense]|uniref:SDR family oxidoreductase n=1 Tax=Bradyrhizobium yuanmingense TaxID=108015 RepID=A0A0R3CUF7_9BRAD|nr:SDR family NAD(P)-dependent oxidoreductase [Bradyrhizobium yuanmingense]KRP98755.1 hypothetical protein AOQ72_16775 [Bradyrhizobium yuanmingense]
MISIETSFGLRDRVAVITGGASGIGKACVQALRECGVHVVSADRTYAGGGKADEVYCDVTDEQSTRRLAQHSVNAYGRLDIWINAAGVMEVIRRTVDQKPEEWDRVISVNLRGTYLGCKEAATVMQRSGGAIVNIGSVAAMAGIPASTAYGPSKAAVATLTRNLACEWARLGIRVNCVAPGYIDTPMSRELFKDDAEVRDTALSKVPMRKLGQPMDIAATVLFLCSSAAAYITGVVMPVDGGWSASAGAR